MDDWITGDGARADSLTHFSWHAALHELSTGDLDAVRRRYDAQLRPTPDMGCRSLVDSGSLLWRWALTPGCGSVPGIEEVIAQSTASCSMSAHTVHGAARGHSAVCRRGRRRAGDPCAQLCRRRRSDAASRWSPRSPGRCAGSCSGTPRAAADDLAALEPAAVARRRQRRPARGGRGDPDRRTAPAGRYDDADALVDVGWTAGPAARDEWFRAAGSPARTGWPASPQLRRRDLAPLTVIPISARPAGGRALGHGAVLVENWLPWQLQMIVPSSTEVTGQPWWVQMLVNALNSPPSAG